LVTSVRIVVADAGPLIALGRLDALHLLPALFAEIQVTATVLAECAARPDFIDAQRIGQAVRDGWLKPCADQFEGPSGRLDPGEASAIARALEIDAGLLLDDRAAVVYARALGLKVIGTLGLLVLAKRRGEIAQVAPFIGQLQAGGHYLGPSAVQAALHAAGEMVS
jgi:predicted nucleic acid-binding protein